MATFFFCGIGGIGMSSIALYLKRAGHTVFGSDRSFDAKDNSIRRLCLERSGIRLFPQDGSGVSSQVDTFVVSTAVEDHILDVQKAKQLGLSIKKRAQVLAHILHEHRGIAVGGTSGKTTVTAMIGHILYETGRDPVMINGGVSLNAYHQEPLSNLIFGQSDFCVVEADESDGSIELYRPDISVVTNLSLDHKPVKEIQPLFEAFLNRASRGGVVNADCPFTADFNVTQPHLVSFSCSGKKADFSAHDIHPAANGIQFQVNGRKAFLPIIGRHNVENALAALAAAHLAGVSLEEGIEALSSFKGTQRRLEYVGQAHGVTVIDDYAHNPEKIRAAITALRESFPEAGRLFIVYQPHGFAPLRLMRETLIKMLNQILNQKIFWIMPKVYYAGGTVAQDISSDDIIQPLAQKGHQVYYIPEKEDILTFLLQHVREKDQIVVMGARDAGLSDFAARILTVLTKRDGS